MFILSLKSKAEGYIFDAQIMGYDIHGLHCKLRNGMNNNI